MSLTSEVGFTGHIEPAQCECHKGQFMATVFLVHPVAGHIHLANCAYPTEAIAEKELDGFVKAVAVETMKDMGIKEDSIVQRTITRGPEAVKSVQRLINGANENLH